MLPLRKSEKAPPVIPVDPMHSQKDTVMHAKALLKFYCYEERKFGGLIGENLSTIQREYELICDSLQVPRNERAKNMHVLFTDMALDFYLTYIKNSDDGKDVWRVFQRMRAQFFSRGS